MGDQNAPNLRVRLEPDTLAKLKARAKAESRTIKATLERILDKEFKEEPFTDKP